MKIVIPFLSLLFFLLGYFAFLIRNGEMCSSDREEIAYTVAWVALVGAGVGLILATTFFIPFEKVEMLFWELIICIHV